MKKILFIIMIILLIQTTTALATSSESITAKKMLENANQNIQEMIARNISINRVNESYQEAFQLYTAQIALEERNGKANYNLIMEYALEINSIKEVSIEAKDELGVFIENFESASKESNFSEMQEEYNKIILSFEEERFEDTLELINKGYNRISEIQSSQTAVNAFYLSTSRTVKNFFINNWLKLLIIISISLILILIFWNTFIRVRMRIGLNNLIIQKKAIKNLIKNMQASYFKTRKISESEYSIKLKKFEELIRDIDRQIMVLEEDIFKLNKKDFPKK